MELEERKRIILRRQFLSAPGDKLEVAGGLCGIQAQYTKNAYHALQIRTKARLASENWGEGLYKSWTLRGTVHVYPRKEQPLFIYAAHASGNWAEQMYLTDSRVSMERKQVYERLILQRLDQGCATREELKEICQAGGMTETEQEVVFHPWGGVIRMMAERGELAYCVEERKIFARCERIEPMPRAEAHKELLHRYLTHYGPVAVADAAYFFHWKRNDIRTMLDSMDDLQSDVCAGQTVYWLGERDPGAIPECMLLAGFDPLMLGYEKTQSIFLPCEYIRGVFNLTGIVFPTILYRGNVVGKWKETKGKVELTAFQALTPHVKRRIEEKACSSVEGFKSVRWTEE